MILKCLLEFGGLGLEELRKKLVNMGCDSSSVLQAIELMSRCAIQRKGSHILSGVHCFAQKIHFLVVTLLNLDLVHQLKGILQNMYDFLHTSSLRSLWNFRSLLI